LSPTEGTNIHLFGYYLNNLSKKLGKDQIHINIAHNMPDDDMHPKLNDFLAIGYGKTNCFGCPDKKNIISIYYTGRLSINKYMQIAYYALNHLEDLSAKQIDLNLENRFASGSIIGVPDSLLDIVYSNNEIINEVLHEKAYSYWLSWTRINEVSYYFQDSTYHVCRLLNFGDLQNSKKPFPKIESKAIFQIDNINSIIKFPHDYLIFNKENCFYHIEDGTSAVTGPYRIPLSPKYHSEETHVVRNLAMGVLLEIQIGFELDATANLKVIFNRKTKMVASNFAQVWFDKKSRKGYGYYITNKQRGEKTVHVPDEDSWAIYCMLAIMLLNSIAIALTLRRSA
jgi:hypothetical protein